MGRRAAIGGVAALASAVIGWLAWSTRAERPLPVVPVVRAQDRAVARPASAPRLAPVSAVPAGADAPPAVERRESIGEQETVEPRATLRVRVTAASEDGTAGPPQPGVRIAVYQPGSARMTRPVEGSEGDLEHSPRTDARGEALLRLPVDVELRLVARGEDTGVADDSLVLAPLAAGEERELALALGLRFDRPLTLYLVDGADGAPIGGAELRRSAVEPASEPGSPWSTRGELLFQSDEEGRVVLDRRALAGAEVQVDAAGFAPRTFQVDHVADGTELALLRGAELTLDVTLRGEPAGGLVARLSVPRRALSATDRGLSDTARVEWVAATDELGRARFSLVPPRTPLSVELEQAGAVLHRSSALWTLEPGERNGATLELGSGTHLFGHLTDPSGAPMADVELWLVPAGRRGPEFLAAAHVGGDVSRRARTDGEGRYAVEGVAAGEWWLGPAPPVAEAGADDPAPLGEWFQVPAALERLELDLRSARGIYLAGTVTDEGRPRAGVALEGQLLGTGARTWATSDAQGGFRLGPLVPGSYRVAALPDGQHGHAGSAAALARAGAGEEAGPIALELASGETLVVLALDADAALAQVERVRWTREDVVPIFLGERATALGTPEVALRGLECGRYSVFVATIDGRVGLRTGLAIDPEGGSRDALVVVEPGYELVLENVAAEPVRVAVWQGPCSLVDAQLAPGERLARSLPAGEASLSWTRGGGAPVERTVAGEVGRSVTVRVGEDEER